MQTERARHRARWAAIFLTGGVLMQLIPFSCGQPILRFVTPWLLDDSFSVVDRLVTAVAPLVLP